MKCNVSLELNLQQWPSSCLLPKDPERFYWNIAIFHQKEGYAFYRLPPPQLIPRDLTFAPVRPRNMYLWPP